MMFLRLCMLPFLLVPFSLAGQPGETPCEAYDRVIREAREKLADRDNLDADFVYRKLRTARLKSQDCASSNPTRQFFPEVDETLQELFNILETQTAAALRAEEKAEQRSQALARESQRLERERQRADSLLQIANRQNRQLQENAQALQATLAQLEDSKAALLLEKERAESVLNRIYFYNGNYGLATNGDSEQPKYGYINKQLETLIPFEYDEASPFDDSGFARVRKGNTALLINTEADEYRLAENLDQLTSSITALDLRRLLDRRRSGTRRRVDLSGNSNLVITEVIPPLVGNYQNLRIILANRGQLKDISSLVSVKKLKELQLSQNEISNLKPLASMEQLRHLRLDGNEIEDIRPLGSLRSLVTLNLYGNEIDDFSSLTGLSELEWLNLGRNKIKQYDLSLNLPALRYLNLDGNRLTSLAGVSNLGTLYELSATNNFLRNLKGIKVLSELIRLDLTDNKLRDISGIENLKELKELHLGGNALEDLQLLEQLKNLEVLDLSENGGIRSLAPLSNMQKLRQLNLAKCRNISQEDVIDLQGRLPNCTIVQ